VSPIDAFRARRDVEDLPPMASDDELVAWSRTLVARPRRRRPLVAVRIERPAVPAAPSEADTSMSTEELFAEITARATDTHNRRRVTIRR
jgi:hypothetical protein